MTKTTNGAAPDLIVLGWDDEGKPRAARFPVGQADLVAKAATAMNLTVCKADGAALAELAKKLPNGRLYATGHGFVSGTKSVRQARRAIATRRSADAKGR